jgi:hypothetical protein
VCVCVCVCVCGGAGGALRASIKRHLSIQRFCASFVAILMSHSQHTHNAAQVKALAVLRFKLVFRNWRAVFFQVVLPPVLLTIGLVVQSKSGISPSSAPSAFVMNASSTPLPLGAAVVGDARSWAPISERIDEDLLTNVTDWTGSCARLCVCVCVCVCGWCEHVFLTSLFAPRSVALLRAMHATLKRALTPWPAFFATNASYAAVSLLNGSAAISPAAAIVHRPSSVHAAPAALQALMAAFFSVHAST